MSSQGHNASGCPCIVCFGPSRDLCPSIGKGGWTLQSHQKHPRHTHTYTHTHPSQSLNPHFSITKSVSGEQPVVMTCDGPKTMFPIEGLKNLHRSCLGLAWPSKPSPNTRHTTGLIYSLSSRFYIAGLPKSCTLDGIWDEIYIYIM